MQQMSRFAQMRDVLRGLVRFPFEIQIAEEKSVLAPRIFE
jgi:hypothetical protein